ncbi:efflux RND transporter periplasmic adaptor subunit [Franzmannia qiaohouensis]|uniref:Efflux RND transporter periplasmic adaptor subunit n=1 Tax=Franzmannia qiaohouensis TaxID=1329370 RepID=A0ABU1HBD5_9GAMM|nr:efflux RND transporter periplasmic adaptor subunit [Halomonas qiaohouensis]MDR5904773.1 efflux RND transporter periplasmic adaptor subunit [Halomonas qiaohouensis]
MSKPRSFAAVAVVAMGLTATLAWVMYDARVAEDETITVAQPALSVAVTTPRPAMLPTTLSANGDIMAWQEASIGTEANGLRLASVEVNVGDIVQRGQVLATFASDTVNAELAQSRAAVAEAEAALAEAADNAQRARELQATGAMSAQQIFQYITAERTAQARLESTRAVENSQQLRLAQTQVLAPDDGVISARSATVGAVLPAGQELFRLIRLGRLEWRAEVAASELERLQPGQNAWVTLPGGRELEGRVRTIAPLVDTATRNGLVYVDLPTSEAARAGMFARGKFGLGTRPALTLPRSAVQIRDGFGYVHRVDGDGRVAESKVALGQHTGDRIEILSGLEPDTPVVASGGAFLGDGDRVEVVEGLGEEMIESTESVAISLSEWQP